MMLRIQKLYQNSRPFFVGISGAERRFINSFSVKYLVFSKKEGII